MFVYDGERKKKKKNLIFFKKKMAKLVYGKSIDLKS